LVKRFYCVSACIWQGRDCKLILHFEDGLTLLSSGQETLSNQLATQVFWHHSYEEIKSTGDDGVRLFWVDFGGEVGEQVS